MKRYDNQGNHFFIEIIPSIDKKGYWDGRFELAIQVRKANIDDESYWELEKLCQMACASLSLMQQDSKIKDIIETFLNTPENDDVKVPLPVDNVTGNVIKVNFEKG